MTKLLKSFSLFVIAISWISQPLTADEGQFYVAPGLQWMKFDNGLRLDNDYSWFLGVGYDLTDIWSVELSTFDLDPTPSSGDDLDLDHYKIDVLYDLGFDLGPMDTFAVTGFGNTNFDGENDTVWDIGLGVSYDLNDSISWRTAVRSFRYLGRDLEDGDLGIETALVFRFGGERARPAAAPVAAAPTPAPAPRAQPAPDSDGDGVPDSRDQCPDTPRTYAVDANGCPIAVEEVARVELLVNFDFDSDVVKPEYFSEIQEVADFMEQYPDVIVELEGHTDSVGAEDYNLDLSSRRANSVMQVLTNRFNVRDSRISAQGFGESQPVASNSTAQGRDQNRRVITVIIKTLQNYRPR